jgi:valyl-tRNA synthetase
MTEKKNELRNESPERSGANPRIAETNWENATAVEEFELIQRVITAARTIRAELKLDARRKVGAECFIPNPVARRVIQANLEPVLRLANLSGIHFVTTKLDPTAGTMRSTALFELGISHGEGIDRKAEIARLRKEIDRLERDIRSKEDRLADEDFRNKAPQPVVEKLEFTKVERQIEQQKLKDQLAQLERDS